MLDVVPPARRPLCCGGGNEAAALLWNSSYQQKPAYAAVNTALGGSTQVPGPPGTPVASNVTSNSLTITWPPSTGTVTQYLVERATGATSTTFTQVGTSTTTSPCTAVEHDSRCPAGRPRRRA